MYLMQTNPATEFVSYRSARFASNAKGAQIGDIIKFGLVSYEQYGISK